MGVNRGGFVLVAMILALTINFASGQFWNLKGKYPKCLYCKRQDEQTLFSYTYSYCKDRNICVPDQWNYVNQWCASKWIPGWMVDVDKDCEAMQIKQVCPNFVSGTEYYGKNVTYKQNLVLPEGAMCTMSIDATKAVARVLITEATSIGVLWNQYDPKKWITIPEGMNQ